MTKKHANYPTKFIYLYQQDEDDTEPSPETTSVRVAETQSNFASVNQSVTSVENQSSETGNQTFSMGDLQELIQHVQWLQLQLKQVRILFLAHQMFLPLFCPY